MVLQGIQQLIGEIYDVSNLYDVHEFLITDAEHARRLDTSENAREVDEKLLLAEGEDGLRLSLYVDQQVLDLLRQEDPLEHLHGRNLEPFWTALEGVSHFAYLTWNAKWQRGISLHELEMQAEVDKYVLTSFLYGRQRGHLPPTLHHLLFEQPVLDEALDEQGRLTYDSANRYAGRFCRRLEERYLNVRRMDGGALLRELRRFYRLSGSSKIRHIDSAMYARAS